MHGPQSLSLLCRAFNAIISSSVIAFNLSYLVPILLLVLTRRRGLGTGERSFNLGKWGFPINLFGTYCRRGVRRDALTHGQPSPS